RGAGRAALRPPPPLSLAPPSRGGATDPSPAPAIPPARCTPLDYDEQQHSQGFRAWAGSRAARRDYPSPRRFRGPEGVAFAPEPGLRRPPDYPSCRRSLRARNLSSSASVRGWYVSTTTWS